MGMPGVTKTSQFRTEASVVFAGRPEVVAGSASVEVPLSFSIGASIFLSLGQLLLPNFRRDKPTTICRSLR